MADEQELGLADGLMDDAEVASTAVTGMSAYARTDDATSRASTSGRPASTVGGRRPARQARKVGGGRGDTCMHASDARSLCIQRLVPLHDYGMLE